VALWGYRPKTLLHEQRARAAAGATMGDSRRAVQYQTQITSKMLKSRPTKNFSHRCRSKLGIERLLLIRDLIRPSGPFKSSSEKKNFVRHWVDDVMYQSRRRSVICPSSVVRGRSICSKNTFKPFHWNTPSSSHKSPTQIVPISRSDKWFAFYIVSGILFVYPIGILALRGIWALYC